MAGAAHGFPQGDRRGLEFGGVAAAEENREEGRPAEVVHEAPGVRRGLVGDEGEIVAGGAEGAEAGVDAGIGGGAAGEVGGIGRGDFPRGEVGVHVRAFERAEGQDADAVADVGRHLVEGKRGQAMEGAHTVGGGGEIGAGVDERAVEVEHEELGLHTGDCSVSRGAGNPFRARPPPGPGPAVRRGG